MTDRDEAASAPPYAEAAANVVAQDFATVYARHTERGTILALVAELDRTLQEALEARFLADKDVKDSMFNQYGALSNTDAKAKLAYLLGVIPKEDFEDIQRIGRIRNRFAHNLEAKDCDHPTIAGQIDNLQVIARFDKPIIRNALMPSNIALPHKSISEQMAKEGIDLKLRNFRLAVSVYLLNAIIKAS